MKITVETNERKYEGSGGIWRAAEHRSAASRTLWQPIETFWKTAVAATLFMYVLARRIVTGTLFFAAAAAVAAGAYGAWSGLASFGDGAGGLLLGLGCGIAALGLAVPAFKLGGKFHAQLQTTVRLLKAQRNEAAKEENAHE
ncbi:hypothetical protein [Saccharibacillus sacchari]|uniref:Uncharacterized protein n=1 Tax=Saccharibacillus sacchari TaxID=456493 RepID=A0ACC6P9S8_9BACL